MATGSYRGTNTDTTSDGTILTIGTVADGEVMRRDGTTIDGVPVSTGLAVSATALTNTLATGKAGGQSVIGGTAASENLLLTSTAHATKGLVAAGSVSTGLIYDGALNRVGLGRVPDSNAEFTMHGSGGDNPRFHFTNAARTGASQGGYFGLANVSGATADFGFANYDGGHVFYASGNPSMYIRSTGCTMVSALILPYASKTTTYSMGTDVSVCFVSAPGGNWDLGLPAANTRGGMPMFVKKTTSTNTVRIVPVSGNIEGAATFDLTSTNAVTIVSDGTDYWIV
jgi:hypothetical protein